ncbi:MAG: PAS domain S-box protein [Pirellulales bacterium]
MELNIIRSAPRSTDDRPQSEAPPRADLPTSKPGERALAVTEERLKLLLEASHDGIWDWDLATGEGYWTQRVYSMLGLHPDDVSSSLEALGRRIHPEDLPRFQCFLDDLRQGRATDPLELRLQKADGSFGFFRIQGKSLCDGAATPVRAIGSLTDVTDRRLAENALRQSEQRHRALVSVLTSIVWITDPHGEFVEPQISWQAYTGQSWEQQAGRGWLDAIHPDERQEVARRWSTAVERKQIFEAEGRLWHAPTGRYLHFATRGVPMFARDGTVREWVGVMRDIDDQWRAESARRAAEDALRTSEVRFRTMADATPVMIRILGDDQKCTYVNRGWLEFTGRTLEQEISGGWSGEVHLDDLDRCLHVYGAAFERREPFTLEYRLRRADGEYRWVLDNSVPLRSERGPFQGYIGTCIDITHRKQSENRLREAADYLVEQRQWLESVLNLLPMPMLLIDPVSAKVTFSNQAARQTAQAFSGGPRDDTASDHLCDAQGHRLAEDEEPVARVSRGERLRGFEVHLQRPDGTRSLIVNSESLPAMHSHERMAVLLYQDITDQKQVEADLRRANQAKDALLAMLGHELRNPLAAITSAAELLELLDSADSEFGNARQILQTHIQHLVQLVDDMLDVSRLTSGKIRIRRETLDLRDVIQQSLQTCESVIDERRHRLSVEMPNEFMPVEGDAARLEQVFVNLLTNAAKYTEEGGQIAVTAELSPSEAVVRVRDNGIGIRSDLLPQVFELFRQLNPSLHRAEGGLGIGLNIVKNLVELHGGSVAAASEGPHRGSEFVVRLPRMTQPSLPSRQEPPSEPVTTTRQAPLRVMVVEDNADIAHSMVALVRHLGHEVELAHDGKAALAVAQRFLPQIALFDIGLPGMNGLELAQAFRQDDRLRSAFLVALTGFGQAEDRRRSLEAGFDEHLVKPLNFARLQQMLDRFAPR